MLEFEDSEYGGQELPTMRTPGAKKTLTRANEKLCRSTREENIVSRFNYNDCMTYDYAFMMKVAIACEPKNFAVAVKDP